MCNRLVYKYTTCNHQRLGGLNVCPRIGTNSGPCETGKVVIVFPVVKMNMECPKCEMDGVQHIVEMINEAFEEGTRDREASDRAREALGRMSEG